VAGAECSPTRSTTTVERLRTRGRRSFAKGALTRLP
jgi:hypothetical protein